MHMEAREKTVLDLFCGAGGMSLGFKKAGFQIVRAIDHFRPAIETYQHNIGPHIERIDLSQPIELETSDVIIGGPPCQGFSSAGLRQHTDRRNILVGRFASIVADLRPTAFVFENVEGFLTAENGKNVIDLLDPLIEAGYQIHLRKVNAANFGVPQHRKRIIAIGGLGWAPSFPEYTHTAYGAPGAQLASQHLPLTPSIMDSLRTLPPASPQPPGAIQGHVHRQLSPLELQRAIALKPGQTMRDLPEELQHTSFRRRAARRVMDGTPTEKRGGAPSGIKRLKPGEPSKAITGGMQGEFLHPYEHRPLTIRECARLQTFPDDFIFIGGSADQMQLIGNAVPPLLAERIAESLLKDVDRTDAKHQQSLAHTGELLSFIPTLSSGVSPALRYVIELVNQRYLKHPVIERLTLWD
ncbi:DNA cytosine methyltransferase [Oscillochloris sp. ZM17-4]|uniref:DNA cytosine methyltransferase n=1 Tax=Oscillochloris sp. ZM17-4 TaxID=2866714 RepID=UPI001C739267|nr:DNA cytosine methyltransferase [Oscillochloris sp. ZM17-4]MBX0327285.1 DNA cytosine methyltransferase [Oscillochloris sp. ZM17-4]